MPVRKPLCFFISHVLTPELGDNIPRRRRGIKEGKAVDDVGQRPRLNVRLISRNRQEVIENSWRRCGRIIEDDSNSQDLSKRYQS